MKSLRLLAIIASFVVSIMSLSPGLALAVDDQTVSAKPNCRDITAPVALAPGQEATEHITGTLCLPKYFATKDRQLDILVHGATYNRTYWNFPAQSPQDTYVNRTLAAGRAVFAYDRLGAGGSSHPSSSLLTTDTDAYVLHQIVEFIRKTHLVQNINVVGHSLGSIIGIHEAATYHDIDRLVLTGSLHGHGSKEAEAVQTALYPASLDPQFASKGYDEGYLTTTPNARGKFFYYLPGADPAVVAYDEAHKDVVSATLFGNFINEFYAPAGSNLSNQVDVPVLVVDGQYDLLYCGLALDCNSPAAVTANEAPYYTSSPSFTAKIIANTGHDVALHTSANNSFATINKWLQSK